MMEKLEMGLTKLSAKFSNNAFLNIIMGAFMMLMPMTMTGSIASLLNAITLAPYQNFLASTGIGAGLTAIYQFTVGILAIWIVFGVGHSYASKKGLTRSAVTVGLVAIAAFLTVTPYDPAGGNLPTSWLASQGMFVGIIIGFMTGAIFRFCQEKDIQIKLPKQVPPMVAQQFSAILPAVFTLTLALILRTIFSFTSFGNMHQAVYTLVATPLYAAGANIFGLFILSTMLTMFWFFGIHGGMTVYPIIMMLFMPLQMENLAAFQAGLPRPNMVCGTSLMVGTGSLTILCAIFLIAKSKTLRSIAKLAIVPSFFGVDEPAYFGIPVILNPIFFLPFTILANVITIFGTYLLQILHLLPAATGASVGFNLPFFVTNFVQFGWAGALWGCVLFVLTILVYIPFIRTLDKQMLAQEAEQETAAQA
ncbi:MAG: PTS sugar transporter subunit IIC [Solobacterium sp.]|nr:PTS sugar transporter subunit IIC [Solobacterium sp.]